VKMATRFLEGCGRSAAASEGCGIDLGLRGCRLPCDPKPCSGSEGRVTVLGFSAQAALLR
jgi:hypothetical protein